MKKKQNTKKLLKIWLPICSVVGIGCIVTPIVLTQFVSFQNEISFIQDSDRLKRVDDTIHFKLLNPGKIDNPTCYFKYTQNNEDVYFTDYQNTLRMDYDKPTQIVTLTYLNYVEVTMSLTFYFTSSDSCFSSLINLNENSEPNIPIPPTPPSSAETLDLTTSAINGYLTTKRVTSYNDGTSSEGYLPIDKIPKDSYWWMWVKENINGQRLANVFLEKLLYSYQWDQSTTAKLSISVTNNDFSVWVTNANWATQYHDPINNVSVNYTFHTGYYWYMKNLANADDTIIDKANIFTYYEYGNYEYANEVRLTKIYLNMPDYQRRRMYYSTSLYGVGYYPSGYIAYRSHPQDYSHQDFCSVYYNIASVVINNPNYIPNDIFVETLIFENEPTVVFHFLVSTTEFPNARWDT